MTAATPDAADLRAIAARLARRPVSRVEPARGGGNNRLYRVDCGSDAFALKFYPPQEEDSRDRLGAEWRALSFLYENGATATPQPIARDPEAHCALHEWIEGAAPGETTEKDLDALAEFLAGLHGLRSAEGAGLIAPASASCLTLAAAVRQYDARFARLWEVAQEGGARPGLAGFLAHELSLAAVQVKAWALEVMGAEGWRPASELPRSRQTLSPSDFGFHNALRRPDGRLAFIDFEYFGWDDPAKMLADLLLHPGMELDTLAQRRLFTRLAPMFAATDPAFNFRFRILAPICALIWCLIMLNEFLPERWVRRNLAGRDDDRDVAQDRQLEKARQMLARINQSLTAGDDDGRSTDHTSG